MSRNTFRLNVAKHEIEERTKGQEGNCAKDREEIRFVDEACRIHM